MARKEHMDKRFRGIYRLLIVVSAVIVIASVFLISIYKDPLTTIDKEIDHTTVEVSANEDPDKIENGIHVRTGLIAAEGLTEVVNNCTTCHSAKLVIQNRMGKERWEATIRWMQETQNLWDLGKNESIIIDYLVKNYPPKNKGRREVLTNVEWYQLKE